MLVCSFGCMSSQIRASFFMLLDPYAMLSVKEVDLLRCIAVLSHRI